MYNYVELNIVIQLNFRIISTLHVLLLGKFWANILEKNGSQLLLCISNKHDH